MEYVEIDEQQKLTNQFTITYGKVGVGKTTFMLSSGEPTILLPFDKRHYSAVQTAMELFGTPVHIPKPLMDIIGTGESDMNAVIDKRQVERTRAGTSKKWKQWVGDQDVAKRLQAIVTEVIEDVIAAPRDKIAMLAVDDAKWLHTIWGLAETGVLWGAPKEESGAANSALAEVLGRLQRASFCDKDVIMCHHLEETWEGEGGDRAPTGEFKPKWFKRMPGLADQVIEHFIDEERGDIGYRFVMKFPADQMGLYRHEFYGRDECRYDVFKSRLLGELE